MRYIYKRATRVIVWLGLRTPGLKEAFPLASQLAECRRERASDASLRAVGEHGSDPSAAPAALTSNAVSPMGQRISRDHIPTDLQGIGLDDKVTPDGLAFWLLTQNPEAAGHLRELLARPFFKRIWCIQEVLVSAWAIAKCEDLEINFMDLIACTQYLHYSQTTLFTGQTFEFWNFIYANGAGEFNSSRVEGSMGKLLDCLAASRDFEASDKRDKVFTLFGITDEGLNTAYALSETLGGDDNCTGIAKQTRDFFINRKNDQASDFGPHANLRRHPALRADYNKDLVAVYRDLTRFQMRMPPRILDVLSFVSHNEEPTNSSFPSWVPKWFEPRSASPMKGVFVAGLVTARTPYFARVHDNPIRGWTRHPELLQIEGFRVDRVHRVSDVTWHELNKNVYVRNIWTQLFNATFKFPSNLSHHTGESLEMAFFRTLTVDALGAGSAATANTKGWESPNIDDLGAYFKEESRRNAEAYIKESATGSSEFENAIAELPAAVDPKYIATERARSKAPEPAEDHAQRVTKWESGARSLSHNRRVYITQQGRMGLGPRMMREGDEVCVLYGGSVPFILRQQGDGHIFIADTYLHDEDVMWGKLVDAVSEKRSRIQGETFKLR